MRRRGLALGALIGIVALVVVAAVVVGLGREESNPSSLRLPQEIVGPDPLAFEKGRTTAYARAAAFGLSHALFAKSPGGVAESARRTDAFRPLIEEAAAGSGLDAGLLEAIVFLESAGRPDVIAGHDVSHAAGLTQILAETATSFLGMRVDLAASRRLTRKIEAARARGNAQVVGRLQAARRRVDARFDPAQALAGTVRYLTEARRRLGRDDLAVVSYHMGIGNLTGVLRAYTGRANEPIETVVDEEDLDYARLYFDSSPARHRDAWEQLAAFGDDSQSYYWRVLAAREIMRLFRENPAELDRLAALHGHGPSAELVLHPPGVTERFAETEELEAALDRGVLATLPNDPARLYFRIRPKRASASPSVYRSLTQQAADLLGYVAAEVHKLSGDPTPLTVTQAAYDEASARATPGAAPHASLHASGNSFDVRRQYGSGAQAEAFQWALERLEALGLIAWFRDDSVIHVTVSPNADVRPAPPRFP
jgi:hypothetical protein